MSQIIEVHRDNFTISTDTARLDHDAIADILSRAYWTNARPRDQLDKAIANSLVFGLYNGVQQIGLARVVSDYSIFAYLCDVCIHEDFRGIGLGKWLMETVLAYPDLKGVRRWTLRTRDAHDLYRKYGFELTDNSDSDWMELVTPFPNQDSH